MKTVRNILLILWACCLVAWGYSMYRQHTHGTWSAYWNSSPKDCGMKLPPNMRVVYNVSNKRYAVEITNSWGKQFLWGRSRDWVDESFDVNTDFSDSCIAKSFAKQYLKEQAEYNARVTGYK